LHKLDVRNKKYVKLRYVYTLCAKSKKNSGRLLDSRVSIPTNCTCCCLGRRQQSDKYSWRIKVHWVTDD